MTQPFLPLDWTDPVEALAALRTELAATRAANAVKCQQLATPGGDGRRTVPDPLGVLALRLNTALDFLFDHEDDRLRFDLGFEQKMAEVLDQCLAQRGRTEPLARLAHDPRPGLFLPGQ